MADNVTNGTRPLVEERAPTAAWRLTDDLTLQEQLDIRTARLEGLELRAEEDDA